MATDQLLRVLFETLRARKSEVHETEAFDRLRHNDDLCPRVQDRVEQTLNQLRRHTSVTYDVQGPRDNGVDVVVRLTSADSEEAFVALQIKADNEAVGDIYRILKSQYHDARQAYGDRLAHYFILLAWDYAERRTQLRNVLNDFVREPGVTVIEPQHLWHFLYRMSVTQSESVLRSAIVDSDPVISDARQAMSFLTLSKRAIVLEAAVAFIEEPDHLLRLSKLEGSLPLRRARVVDDVLGTEEDPFPLGVVVPKSLGAGRAISAALRPADIEQLADDLAFVDNDSYVLDHRAWAHLLAIAYDAVARFDKGGADLYAYLDDLVNIRDESDERSEQLLAKELLDIVGYSGSSDLSGVG